MTDEEAIQYLRRRRVQWFLPDEGPALPPGITAHWRMTPHDPDGWQGNMIGYIEAPPIQLGAVLDQAITFFGALGCATWVDVDEFSPLWERQQELIERGFVVEDNWDAMICRGLQSVRSSSVQVKLAATMDDLRRAAWIAEQHDASAPVPFADSRVQRRTKRYVTEFDEWQTQFALATLAGQTVGAARLTEEPLPVIVGVATLREARNHGVATALTAFLCERALSAKGACALYTERDSQALRIYRRLGFEPLYRCQAWVRRSRVA